jgi:hypothetical protein
VTFSRSILRQQGGAVFLFYVADIDVGNMVFYVIEQSADAFSLHHTWGLFVYEALILILNSEKSRLKS